MSAEAPHRVTFSCPRTPATTQKPPRVSLHRKNHGLAQCAGGQTVLSYFPESACIMLVTHVGTAQSWQAFSGQDTPATDLLKRVSHLNTRGSLITLHFRPVLQFRQLSRYCDQLTVSSWYQACDALYVTSLWQCRCVLFIFILDTAFKSLCCHVSNIGLNCKC